MEVVLTKENFEEEAVKSEIPVLIDLWAPWCGPCRMLAPVLAEIAEEFEGKIKIGKVNVDEQPELGAAFNAMSIPMLVLMKDGEVAATTVGFQPKDAVMAFAELED